MYADAAEKNRARRRSRQRNGYALFKFWLIAEAHAALLARCNELDMSVSQFVAAAIGRELNSAEE
ncbi:MAG: hypothetical protein ING19_17270 [Azospirillum sp.]|nr:hypothetical protein [Azospirillum sp.]